MQCNNSRTKSDLSEVTVVTVYFLPLSFQCGQQHWKKTDGPRLLIWDSVADGISTILYFSGDHIVPGLG